MKKRRVLSYALLTIGISAVLAIVIGVSFGVGVALAPWVDTAVHAAPAAPARDTAQPAAPRVEQSELMAAFERTLVEVYQTSLPSVVRIEVTQKVDLSSSDRFNRGRPPFAPSPDGPQEFFQRGEGSGFVWDEQGHIVTNFHVIADATEVEVEFAGGRRIEAEVVGTDPDADLAVLKVELPDRQVQPLPLGDSDVLRPGQLAIAIGNPFGQEFTMTSGIISAVGRTIRSGNTQFSIPEVIQTDAPVNPGNSGGPLLNRFGEVIGINTQIVSRSGANAGIGFAVPVNIAKEVIPVLIVGDTFEYSWLGISGRGLIPEAAEAIDLPLDTEGILLISVAEDSPAEEAGLQGTGRVVTVGDQDFEFGGDIIVAINGHLMRDMDELISFLVAETRPGDEVSLDVIRTNGKPETISVILGVRPRPYLD